jgi:hypothetical protein
MTIPTALSKDSGLAGVVRSLWAESVTNWRAGIGLILVGALVGVSGLVALHRATAGQIAAYAQKSAQLERIVAIEREHEWPQRAEESAKLLQMLDNRLWTAESEGVAQADLQAWIGGIGHEIGMPMFDIRVESTRPKDLAPDLRQITATITAQPSEAAVVALLERIAEAPHLTIVSRLHIRQQPGPLIELVLVGYSRVTGPKLDTKQ